MGNKIALVPPKELLSSSYRKDLWKNVEATVRKIEKVLPIASLHVMGSFTTAKRRPADVDFIVMVQTPNRKQAKWSVDMVIVPDNNHGEKVLADAKKWMKQKYGAKKSKIIRLK